jgi:hypothetical protein
VNVIVHGSFLKNDGGRNDYTRILSPHPPLHPVLIGLGKFNPSHLLGKRFLKIISSSAATSYLSTNSFTIGRAGSNNQICRKTDGCSKSQGCGFAFFGPALRRWRKMEPNRIRPLLWIRGVSRRSYLKALSFQ